MEIRGPITTHGQINVHVQDTFDPNKTRLITTTDNMELNTAIPFAKEEERQLEVSTLRVKELGNLFRENTPPPLTEVNAEERNRKTALQKTYSEEKDTIIAKHPTHAHHLQLVWEGKESGN